MHNPDDFDWNDIKYFLAVVRAGSTSGAGRNIGVSQSTIQRRIAALEASFGEDLFLHQPTGYALTETGREIVEHARRLESAAAALGRHLQERNGPGALELRITAAPTIADRLARAGLIDRMRSLHPNITLKLLMTDHFLDVARGEADVAIRSGEAIDDDLWGCKIGVVPWAVYASSGYVAHRGKPIVGDDLRLHSWIGFAGEVENHSAANWLKQNLPAAAISTFGTNISSILLAAKSGHGLALLPSPMADGDPDLYRLLVPVPALNASVYALTTPALRNVHRVRAFFDFLHRNKRAVRSALAGSISAHRHELPSEAKACKAD
jgi:DNA-binding transcriptional LysR family regulator